MMEQGCLDKKRIIKNTFLLYGRMMLFLLINLYCSRIVLQTLGVVDYGVCNVVGGVVSLFSLIFSPLNASTNRFLTFEIGTGNMQRLNQVLSASMLIHLGLALLVCLFMETLGLWFVSNVLVIPAERLQAAIWVLHFSVLSAFFFIVQAPFTADIISHERMGVFAAISLMEVVLKLVMVLCLARVDYDKLIAYGFLFSLISVVTFLVNVWYCHTRFEEARGKRLYDKGIAKDLLSFMGWSLTGGLAGICNGQGVNILLNVFFGPSVNAARGVAMQVQNALNSFSSNIHQAINPQITITYASNRLDDMYKLVVAASKYTYLFLFVLSLPIFCYAPYVLTLWLGHYPPFAVDFVRIILILNLIEAQVNPLVIANHATGNIRKFQIWVEAVNVLTLPLSYLFLKFVSAADPVVVYYIFLLVALAAQCVRIAIVLPNIRMRLAYYLQRVIVPLIKFSVLMAVLGYGCVRAVASPDIYNFIMVSGIMLLSGCLLAFFVALSDHERTYVISLCRRWPFGKRL